MAAFLGFKDIYYSCYFSTLKKSGYVSEGAGKSESTARLRRVGIRVKPIKLYIFTQ